MSKHTVDLQDFPSIRLSEYTELTIEYDDYYGIVQDVTIELPSADSTRRVPVSIYEIIELETLPTLTELIEGGGNG